MLRSKLLDYQESVESVPLDVHTTCFAMPAKGKSRNVSKKPGVPHNVKSIHNSSSSSDEDGFTKNTLPTLTRQSSDEDADSPFKPSKNLGTITLSQPLGLPIHPSSDLPSAIAMENAVLAFRSSATRLSKAWSEHFHFAMDLYVRKSSKRTFGAKTLLDAHRSSFPKLIDLMMLAGKLSRIKVAEVKIRSLAFRIRRLESAFTAYITMYKEDYVHIDSPWLDESINENDDVEDNKESQRKLSDDVERELKILCEQLESMSWYSRMYDIKRRDWVNRL